MPITTLMVLLALGVPAPTGSVPAQSAPSGFEGTAGAGGGGTPAEGPATASMDKDIIGKIVRQHTGNVKACYCRLSRSSTG